MALIHNETRIKNINHSSPYFVSPQSTLTRAKSMRNQLEIFSRDCYICIYIVIRQKFFTYIDTLAASVDGLLDEAGVARDLATPPKPTLAIDLLLDDSRIVTSAAAE